MPSREITFVTSNLDKFTRAEKDLELFHIKLSQLKLDIVEPQDEDISKVAQYKAIQAFDKCNKPVIVQDTGWQIPALNGFPGPFMHYISEWFSAEDLLNLMKNKLDRTVIIQNVLVFKDETQTKIFESLRKGKLLEIAKGDGIPIDQIATFRKDEKTIAECKKLGISSFDEKNFKSNWSMFGEWFNAPLF